MLLESREQSRRDARDYRHKDPRFPTFYVLHPFLRVREAVDVLHPGAAAVSEVDAVAASDAVFVALLSVVFDIADAAARRVFVGTSAAVVVLSPVSAAAACAYSPERPNVFSFPNTGCPASSSSCVEAVNEESIDNSKRSRANCDCGSILSNRGLRHNKTLGHCCNKPSHDRNTVSDTSDLPTDATRNHSRKTGPR
jgi:hypothetical protein